MPAKILFLTLRVFSLTGGIEKVNRVAGYVINNMKEFSLKVYALHDHDKDADTKYLPSQIFKGFNSSSIKFVLQSIAAGLKSRIIIISHINLLSLGYVIKKLSPKTKVLVFAHGIEIWKPLSTRQQKMLRRCDRIIAVSNFTRDVIIKNQSLLPELCSVLNNCLDPFLPAHYGISKSAKLLTEYGFEPDDFVILTLTRLSFKEKYKGYEKVLKAMAELNGSLPTLKYLIVGKYNPGERKRLQVIINNLHLEGDVVFTGFVEDSNLGEYYTLADAYVMPSKKEGFGIVFIEAMNYGLPVIAGNKDGSVDALANGCLGMLVDPDDQPAITSAIQKVRDNKIKYVPDRALLLDKFSNETYAKNLKHILLSALN